MEIQQIRMIDADTAPVCDVETGICEIPAQKFADNP